MRPDSRLLVASEPRVQLGLALQPLVASLVTFVFIPVPGVAVFVGITAILITAGMAYPLLLWLLKRGPISAVQVLVSGVVLGNVPSGIALIAVTLGQLRDTGALPAPAELVAAVGRSSPFGSLAGVVSAGVFWLVAGPRLRAEASRGDAS